MLNEINTKTDKKKIYFLSPSLRKGGAENQLTKLASYLSTSNEVEIITFIAGNDFSDLLINSNISLKTFHIKSVVGFWKLLKYIKNSRPHVLICFMFSANIVGRVIKLFTKVPIITSVRANIMSDTYRILYTLTYRLDNYSTFNSDFALQEFCKNKWTVPARSMVINNAIKVKTNNKEPNINTSSEIRLISIAHFRPSKDYKTLFKAIKILKERGHQIKLTVLGNIDDQKWPFEMLKELDIEENVHIVGFTSNTEKYIDESDLLILSSFLEGTPNALLEAMSRKKPVIASDIPGNDFVITESKGGLLFALGNEADLAGKIIEVINLPEAKRKDLGINGFNFVSKNYELHSVLAKWETLIDRVIQENER